MTLHISALPLLAYKVGPNLFDLSSHLHHVSMRDQMHRAVALAEALVLGKQVKASQQVLIVGAGVAGVAAGIVLARHDIAALIIDVSNEAPFALQRNVRERYVGPYMYEWPLNVYDSQRLPPDKNSALGPWLTTPQPPLSFNSHDPARPADLVADWEGELCQAIAASGGKLCVLTGVDRTSAMTKISRWLAAQRNAMQHGNGAYLPEPIRSLAGVSWSGSHDPAWPITPRFVLLAGGMGIENYTLPGCSPATHGQPFWADDSLLEHHCGKAQRPRIVILGGGDGALQDALRAMTRDRHPVDTWHKLMVQDRQGLLADCMSQLAALEHQHAQVSIWATVDSRRSAANATLDAAYHELACKVAGQRSLAKFIIQLLRTDVESVHLCVREPHFSKTYALNRIMVHLIEASIRLWGDTTTKDRFKIAWNKELDYASPSGSVTNLFFKDKTKLEADLVVVRFGPDTLQLPGQWLGLTTKDTVNRQELAAVPLPLYLPPSK